VGTLAGVVLTALPPAPSGGAAGAASTSTLPKAKKRRVPAPAELRSALARCGLSPSVLTAAGVNAAGATTLVANVRQYLTDHPDDLRDADSSVFAAQASCDQLMRKVQQGQASLQERAGYEAALGALDSARAGRDGVLAAVQTAALANFSSAQQGVLAAIRANSRWKLPVQYLTTTRTDAQWVALRDALANDRQAAAAGVSPDPSCHQLVVGADAVPSTSAAAQNLAAHLADVAAAFRAAATQAL
jgi:hypothetical protein